MSLRGWLLGSVLCLVGSAPALAQEAGAEDTAERTLAPYFMVENGADGVEPFPLESTDVRATVNGVIADVTVTQTYRNDGTVPINARYVFPASTRAAVHGMEFRLGSHRVVAKIRERKQAETEFEEATQAGKTAGLLEQQRPNVFSMAVANIMPGDRVQVVLAYSELLVPNEGVYHFVFPTVVGPRYSNAPAAGAPASDAFVETPYLHKGDSPPQAYTLHVDLSTGVPLADVKSATHDIAVKWEGNSLARVSLADERRFAGNRDFVLDYRLSGEQIQTGLLLYDGAEENHFLLMLQPPARVSAKQIPPREYVFVLDVSGSMDGFPLDTAKLLIRDLIGHLRPSDTFNVVLFAGDAQLLAPRSLAANTGNIQRALSLIDAERGGGGTELQAALETTLALPRSAHVSRTVVVLTDGYIAQEQGAFELIAKNLHTTNFFAFGIGSSVNRYLIEGLARTGQGEPFVVKSAQDAPSVAARFRRYIEAPMLTEIEVGFDGFGAYDVEPQAQPDLFANRPIVMMGKWRGTRTGAITLRGRNPQGQYAARVEVAGVVARRENAALPQLWARSKIARLSDFDVSGENPQTVFEVTQLGLQYSLLTKHTSFIAVVEQIRNPNGEAANVKQPLPLPVGVSELAVADYGSGDEPELLWLALMLSAAALLWTRRRNRNALGSAA